MVYVEWVPGVIRGITLVDGESACVAPCVVLVINDNPYGLMFALRYPYMSCP